MQTTPPLPVVAPSTPSAREPPADVEDLAQPEPVERGEQGAEEDGGREGAVGMTQESGKIISYLYEGWSYSDCLHLSRLPWSRGVHPLY